MQNVTRAHTVDRIGDIAHICRTCCDNNRADNRTRSIYIVPPATMHSNRAYRTNRLHAVNLACKPCHSGNSCGNCGGRMDRSTDIVPHVFLDNRWVCFCTSQRTDFSAHIHCNRSNIILFCSRTYRHSTSSSTYLCLVSL